MARISDLEDEDSHPQASSSKSKIINGLSCLQNNREGDSLRPQSTDNKNPLADFKFDNLPTELLVEIFRHARADDPCDAYKEKYRYPVALSHVCRYWREVAVGAPTLWTSIRILARYTEVTTQAALIYMERSKTCPIFLTWFTDPTDVLAVIGGVIIPGAERWQRITLIAGSKIAPDALLAAMEPLDFPILQDVEISSCGPFVEPFSPKSTLCRNAPLLRRCRFRDTYSLPPLPSNLVVLDYVFSAHGSTEFDLDPLLAFLPHVAHSLEHLRFEPPPTSKVKFTPHTPKIPLDGLKSLIATDSHVIMNHVLTPNLTYFVAFHPREAGEREAAEMFEGFSAPKLQSIQFRRFPLLPFLTTYNLPSMFPQLESVLLSDCTDESAFISLLEPPKPKKPSSLKKASKYQPKQRKVENPFPHLKEFTISDLTTWTSLQSAIEKRLKNGDKTLRKIQLPMEEGPESIMSHLRQWLPKQGIELVLYKPGELPGSTPEFQDEFCDEEDYLLFEMSMEGSEWDDDDDEDDDYDCYWEERAMSRPDYELPSYLDPHQYWDGFYDGYDDEEEEEYDDEDLFYEG